jgi:aspartate/methionine/tyrosine aminotransferase
MESLAMELNKTLEGSSIYNLMSDFGKRFYFPKGIVAQAAEAGSKADKFNATVGMATIDGKPMFLASIDEHLSGLDSSEIYSYAPTTGLPKLRELWKKEMILKNPGLKGKSVSHPIVTAGLTHGLSIIADLFVDVDDTVIVPDMFWGNYKLIVEGRCRGKLLNFPFFDGERINLNALEASIRSVENKKASVVLNFPNNPTGYSPSKKEADDIAALFIKLADENYKIMVVCDDAYFGLFFEDETNRESLFSKLADAHKNILAVKIDGATKEELVWGFRVGFITYGGKDITPEQYEAVQSKTMGAVRASVSNCSKISQTLLLKGLESRSYHEEKDDAFRIMNERYLKVKEVVSDMPAGIPLKVLPFNSGYFMTFEVLGKDAEKLRKHLLDNYRTGTISIAGKYLRVAFSSVDVEKIEELYSIIFKAAAEL